MPVLGSSRLEEPLNRYPVNAVFHGHAHHGSLEGQTQSGIPVYNVSAPLLRQQFPDRPPFRVIEISPGSGKSTPTEPEHAEPRERAAAPMA
jgi:hypothetical protein